MLSIKGDKIIIADDLLATGALSLLSSSWWRALGADIVECAFIAELDFLEGRKKLPEGKVFSLLNF